MTALTANCIDLNIQGNSVYAILKQLANMALQNGYVSDRSAFLQTLLIREKLHSTGFGSGIAVPHGKSACIRRPLRLVRRANQKKVDWKASDGEDVNCWICLGVPQTGEDDQVKIIGTLCRKIIHPDFINQLKQGDTDQVLTLLNQTLTS
ncbi:multiphosphoryl transfer protein 2 [Citrobacter freundii]|nr:multiphosphoryl transfer protein 2 [Citrobacter freundii]